MSVIDLPRVQTTRARRSIYQDGRRDLVAAGQHLVAANTSATAQDAKYRAIVAVRIGIRGGDSEELLLQMLGLAPSPNRHRRNEDADATCACGRDFASRGGLNAHLTRTARRS